MTPPTGAPALQRGFECRWELAGEDADRTKIGGIVSTIQSEPWWEYREHPSNPEYCMQINSAENVELAWAMRAWFIWREEQRRDAGRSGYWIGSVTEQAAQKGVPSATRGSLADQGVRPTTESDQGSHDCSWICKLLIPRGGAGVLTCPLRVEEAFSAAY